MLFVLWQSVGQQPESDLRDGVMSAFDLTGRVAVVTGGNGGIGFAIASALGLAGAAIAVAGRQSGKSRSAVAALRQQGVRALAVDLDVADERACSMMPRSCRGRTWATGYSGQQCWRHDPEEARSI